MQLTTQTFSECLRARFAALGEQLLLPRALLKSGDQTSFLGHFFNLFLCPAKNAHASLIRH